MSGNRASLINQAVKRELITDMFPVLNKEFEDAKKQCARILSDTNNEFIHFEVKNKINELLASHKQAIIDLEIYYNNWRTQTYAGTPVFVEMIQQLALRTRNAIEALNENINATLEYARLASLGEHSLWTRVKNDVHVGGQHLRQSIDADQANKLTLLDDMDLYIEGNKLMSQFLTRGPLVDTTQQMKDYQVKVNAHIGKINQDHLDKAVTIRRIKLLQSGLLAIMATAIVLSLAFYLAAALVPPLMPTVILAVTAYIYLIKAASFSAVAMGVFAAASTLVGGIAQDKEKDNKKSFSENKYIPLHHSALFAAKRVEEMAISKKAPVEQRREKVM